MKCNIAGCNRNGLTERELEVHKKYFHGTQIMHPQAGQQPQAIVAGVCPDCGSTLFYQEGCATCQTCGYSRCG